MSLSKHFTGFFSIAFRLDFRLSVMVSIQCFLNLPLSFIHYGPIPPFIHNYQLLHSMTDSHPQLSPLISNHQHSALVLTLTLYLLTPLVCTVRVHFTHRTAPVAGPFSDLIWWLFNDSMKFSWMEAIILVLKTRYFTLFNKPT